MPATVTRSSLTSNDSFHETLHTNHNRSTHRGRGRGGGGGPCLLNYFCSFDLSCPILEKDNFIKHLYIVLPCLIK